MGEESLSAYYDSRKNNYHNRTDMMKLLLMPFVFVALLGLPGSVGRYVAMYCNFVVPVFFILFGFFRLVPDQEKRMRKLQKACRHAAILFAAMFVCYFAVNLIYLNLANSLNADFFSSLLRKRTLFNFLVLNAWPLPIGSGIWFIQSLTYAYLFFLFAEKTKLSRFYLPILIVLVLLLLATGEFALFFGFPHFSYRYIPANAVTQAIPYMLVGMYLRKYVDKLTNFSQFTYILFFVVGLLAAVGEIELLRRIGKLIYVGHTIGFGLMAVSLCCFVLARLSKKTNFLTVHGNSYSERMYALGQPVAFLLWLATYYTAPMYLGIVNELGAPLSLAVSFALAFLIGLLKNTAILRDLRQLLPMDFFSFHFGKRRRRHHRHHHHHNSEKAGNSEEKNDESRE